MVINHVSESTRMILQVQTESNVATPENHQKNHWRSGARRFLFPSGVFFSEVYKLLSFFGVFFGGADLILIGLSFFIYCKSVKVNFMSISCVQKPMNMANETLNCPI